MLLFVAHASVRPSVHQNLPLVLYKGNLYDSVLPIFLGSTVAQW